MRRLKLRQVSLLLLALGMVAASVTALASASQGAKRVTPETAYPWMPNGASPAGTPENNWQYPFGDYGLTGFSMLKEINTSNVSGLKQIWQGSFDGPTYNGVEETEPIVVSGKAKNLPIESGTMYVSAAKGMLALNPVTGEILWKYTGPNPVGGAAYTSFGAGSRVESYGRGMVFTGQSDGSIVALDAKTGAPKWTAQVSGAGVFAGHTTLSPPAAHFYDDGKDGLVIGGPNYGDAPLRGHLDAYNAKTGALVWRFWTTPDPGQFPAILSWANPAEAALGGAATWTEFAYDPELKSVFLGTGNAYPYTGRQAGKNLWTASMVAVNSNTGALKWYYQSVHHDVWDYDQSNPPMILRVMIDGKRTPIATWGQKTGYQFVRNAVNGGPVAHFPIPEVKVPDPSGKGIALNNLWPTQPEPAGGAGQLSIHCPTAQQVMTQLGLTALVAPNGSPIVPTCPMAGSYNDAYYAWGGSNYGIIDYQHSGYSPLTNDLYICANININAYQNLSPTDWHMRSVQTGMTPTVAGAESVWLTALNMSTNTIDWQVKWTADNQGACYSGQIATAGGLVFTASRGDSTRGSPASIPAGDRSPGGFVYALDAKTGKALWQWQAPDYIQAPPMTYSINGKQYVAIYVEGYGTTNPRSVGKRDLLTVFSL